MDFLSRHTKEILFLARDIITGDYKKDNWLSFLDNLANIFDMDGAFIGLWEKGYIELKYSSVLIKKFLDDNKTKNLSKVNIKNRKIFRDTLVENGYINIEDYQNYEYALDDWKNIGLKSILASIVKSDKKLYGSLHLVSLSKNIKFTSSHIEALQIISNAIASELEKENLIDKLREEKDINAYYVELINSVAIENKVPDVLNSWILSTLNKIKTLSNAYVVRFLFPSENINVMLDGVASIKQYDEDIQSNPLYDVWEKNITDIIEYTDTESIKNHLNPKINLKNAIFIPSVSNNRTVSVLCLGFMDETHLSKKKIELIQTLLKYFSSLVYTYKNISRVSSELSNTEEGLIKAFVSAMEAKDLYTKGHSQHVAIYAKKIGKALGFNAKEQEFLYNAGLLHDIGKIGIPDNILLKPYRLSKHEYEIIKLHPIFSYEIVKNIPKFKKVANCILHHHERMDGSGYPNGLKGHQIEMGARILAIADIFDALTTKRPYRDNLTCDEAIEIMKQEELDQDILSKTANALKESYLDELIFQQTFTPTKFEMARKDMLERDYATGLYRRSAFVNVVNSYIRKKRLFSMFMVDIKNISYINFKYGVDIGDKIVVFVAEELSKITKVDALARTDSDVFMFIYKGTNPQAFKDIISQELKQGIIDKIKQKSCVIDRQAAEKIIGCYITYMEYPKEAKTAEELIYGCITKKKQIVTNNESIYTQENI